MKLLINSPLSYSDVYIPSISDEEVEEHQEAFQELLDICDKFGVHYCRDFRQDGIEFDIHVQKVTLDEVSMNQLFAEVLRLFDYDIRYAALGGAGCDFAIELTAK